MLRPFFVLNKREEIMGRNFKNIIRIFASILSVFCVLLLAITSGNCGKDGKIGVVPEEWNEIAINTVKGVNLLIDATPSMQGFADANAPIFLNLIKNNVAGYLGSVSSNKRYFEFGETINPLAINDLNKIVDPKFYVGKFKTTNISLVIDSIDKWDKDEFTVIMTDFFENDNDINRIVTKFDEVVKKELSFGLIGIRTDFKGKVYDVNFKGKAHHFPYVGKRPIYLLLFGKYETIKKFYEKFQNDLKANYSPSDFNFFIFTKQYAENANNLLNASSSSILKKDDNYNIKDNIFEFSGSYYKIKISSNLKEHTISKGYFNQSKEFYDLKVFDSKNKIFPFGFVSLNKNNNSIEVKIDRTEDLNLDYYFEAKLKSSEAIELTQFKTWEMSQNEVAAAVYNPKNFDGSKTINISYFINQVAGRYNSDLGFIRFIIKK
jgi:hypothetical protein